MFLYGPQPRGAARGARFKIAARVFQKVVLLISWKMQPLHNK